MHLGGYIEAGSTMHLGGCDGFQGSPQPADISRGCGNRLRVVRIQRHAIRGRVAAYGRAAPSVSGVGVKRHGPAYTRVLLHRLR